MTPMKLKDTFDLKPFSNDTNGLISSIDRFVYKAFLFCLYPYRTKPTCVNSFNKSFNLLLLLIKTCQSADSK